METERTNSSDVPASEDGKLQEIWYSSLAARPHDYDAEAAFRRFLKRQKNVGKRTGGGAWWKAAAAVAFLVSLSYLSFHQGEQQIKNKFADIVIEAPWGSTIKTCLPDGSLVWLNAGAKITYSQGFGVSNRSINLEGEGYFEVTKNEKLAFDVLTKEMSVRVLGTRFNFRNYNDDEEAAVSLLQGSVLVSNNMKQGEQARISSNERVSIDKTSGEMQITRSATIENTAEWTKGYLYFDEELLPDIVKKLERSYDVKITIADPSLEQLRFYGNFLRKEQSVTEVLDYLQGTGKLKYSTIGKEITITN